MTKRTFLNLEALEERWNPTDLLYSLGGLNYNWAEKTNWVVKSTGLPYGAEPSAQDYVYFQGVTNCFVGSTSSVVCAGMYLDPNFTGKVDVSGSINIHADQEDSELLGGNLYLDNGGIMTVQNSNINQLIYPIHFENTLLTVTDGVRSKIYLFNDAEMDIESGFTNLPADVYVGQDTNGNESSGTMVMTSEMAYSVSLNATITLSSSSDLYFDEDTNHGFQGGTTDGQAGSVDGEIIVNGGTVHRPSLTTNNSLDNDVYLNLVGGFLEMYSDISFTGSDPNSRYNIDSDSGYIYQYGGTLNTIRGAHLYDYTEYDANSGNGTTITFNGKMDFSSNATLYIYDGVNFNVTGGDVQFFESVLYVEVSGDTTEHGELTTTGAVYFDSYGPPYSSIDIYSFNADTSSNYTIINASGGLGLPSGVTFNYYGNQLSYSPTITTDTLYISVN